MVFNSIEFLLFFPIVYFLYVLLKRKSQNLLLLLASYFFYGYWDYRFLSLLLISTLVDYFVSIQIENSDSVKKRKFFLGISIFSNLSILGFFKYYNFFIQSAIDSFSNFGIQIHPFTMQIILPLGISFYTFQTLSYTIDVYRKDLKAERNFLDFALFVTFFPQLVAGPIERATNLLPQVKLDRIITSEKLEQGALLILIGLFKKVYIADNLALIVNPIFKLDHLSSLTNAECLVGATAFIFQIYGDFSGYSDIARGLSKLLGFELMQNFRHPIFSESMNDFWRRWHISFMNWLRDYVYKSLGKKDDSEYKIHFNNMIVFLISGLWHGANWTFVVWGLYCGLITSLYRIYIQIMKIDPKTHMPPKWRRFVNFLFTFSLMILSVVFFRSENLSYAFSFLGKMFTQFGGIDKNILAMFLKISAVLLVLEFHQYKTGTEFAIFRFNTFTRSLIYILLFYSVVIMGNFNNGFIYFVF